MLDYFTSTIADQPGAVLAVMVVLIILVFYLSYKYVGCKGTDDMRGNFTTGGNMPLWQYGSHHAGFGGSMDRSQDVTRDTMASGVSSSGIDSHAIRGHYGASDPQLMRPKPRRI